MLSFIALLACSSPTPDKGLDGLVFVRNGIIAPATDAAGAGQILPDGRRLLSQPWAPKQTVRLGSQTATAPAQAQCVPLFSVDLGDVSRLVAMRAAAPDTALAFSPKAKRLAIGSVLGQVRVVDAWTGLELARHSLPEARVRDVAWSSDGATLYVTEQSPDAMLWALDATSLNPRWGLRLADFVGTSTPPPGQDIYGVYSLPAGFGLAVLPDDSVVVGATHGWGLSDGSRRNQGQVLRVNAEGQVAARWPSSPAEVTLMHPVLDADGQRVVVAVGHSSSLPAPPGLPVGGVQVLDLPGLRPAASATPRALAPWFKEARVWEALDISAAADTLLLGLNDGRVQLRKLDGSPRAQVDGGAPILAGDVPIHAGVGWARLVGDRAIFATSSTRIPWGAAAPDLRPPSPHPAANTVTSLTLDGTVDWSWTGQQELQGLTVSPDGDELVLGAGARVSDTRRDLYGALVFDLARPTGSGRDRLSAICNTVGPVFFRQALAADGRLALTEYPYADDEGAMHGAYRVDVLR